jgi:hypothetical protein
VRRSSGVAVDVGSQRADRLGQLRRRLACGYYGREMRRELAREESAGNVNGRALRDLAVDLLQHEPHGSGRCIRGQLAQRGIGIHPGAKLKLQLMEQPDEFRRRQHERARAFRFSATARMRTGPERFRTELDTQLRLAGRVLAEEPARARAVDGIDGEALACQRGSRTRMAFSATGRRSSLPLCREQHGVRLRSAPRRAISNDLADLHQAVVDDGARHRPGHDTA